jgi:hypothetical protein
MNSFGELGSASAEIAAVVRTRKDALKRYLADFLREAGLPNVESLAEQLFLVVEEVVTAAVVSGPDAARHARRAAATLLASVRECA